MKKITVKSKDWEASKALGSWTTATKTKVDVFSPTAIEPIAGIPNNGMGKANAKDGDNYVGIKVYDFNSKSVVEGT